MSISIGKVGAVAACLGVLACASGQQRPSDVSGEGDTDSSQNAELSLPRPDRGSSSTAEANTCAERPCISNSDCCGSTSCGIDPERSHVQRYCLGE